MELKDINKNSQVWVYQSDRKLTPGEQEDIRIDAATFTDYWVSHGEELSAVSDVINDHFVVIGVEPPKGKLCGGAIDSSTRLIKSMELKYGLNFFNRLKILTLNEAGDYEYVSFSKLKDYPERLMFNVSVNSKESFDTSFKIPVKDYLASL